MSGILNTFLTPEKLLKHRRWIVRCGTMPDKQLLNSKPISGFRDKIYFNMQNNAMDLVIVEKRLFQAERCVLLTWQPDKKKILHAQGPMFYGNT